MSAQAKICGLSTPEAVRAALDGGAGFVGFMFFDRSPRNVRPELAARMAAIAEVTDRDNDPLAESDEDEVSPAE